MESARWEAGLPLQFRKQIGLLKDSARVQRSNGVKLIPTSELVYVFSGSKEGGQQWPAPTFDRVSMPRRQSKRPSGMQTLL